MVRIKSSVASKKRKKRVLKKAKGQFGFRSKRFREAKRSVIKGETYAFRDRKVKKREYRNLWAVRINAACRDKGITYSRFMKGLKEANVVINRKMLAELAVNSPAAFQKLVSLAKETQPKKPAAKRTKTSAAAKSS